MNFLLNILSAKNFQGKHLEIGTGAGGTLLKMISLYSPSQRPPFVVVDPMQYFPNQIDIVRKNLQKNAIDPSLIDFRTTKSADAFIQAEKHGERFDFIFIDGAHKIRYVMEDLRWARLLNPGGVLCLHDYTPHFPGVYKSVNRFINKYTAYESLGKAGSLLALQKTKSSPQEISGVDLLYAHLWAPILQLIPSFNPRSQLMLKE